MVHDAALSQLRARARRAGGERHRVRKSGAALVVIAAVADVLRLANVVIADTWLQENSSARSRALLAAADVALRVLGVAELEARIAALEALAAQGALLRPAPNGREHVEHTTSAA